MNRLLPLKLMFYTALLGVLVDVSSFACFASLAANHSRSRKIYKQSLQAEFETFLGQKGKGRTDRPAPNLFEIAPKFKAHLKNSRIGYHAFGLERNLKNGDYRAENVLAHAIEMKMDLVQIHAMDHFTGYNDAQIRSIGETARRAGIEIQLDISRTDRKSFDVAFRIANLLGAVTTIRAYIREPGKVRDMIKISVADLREATDRAAERGLKLVLEQHEVLTATEMALILERVARPNLDLLFDFANPITAGRHPEEDLAIIADKVVIAHVKDAIRAPTLNGREHQIGVKLGEGDLNIRRMIFELIMREVDLSSQSVVGYLAEGANRGKVFDMRVPSQTFVPANVLSSPAHLRRLLNQEVRDSREQVAHLIWIRAKLLEFAERAMQSDWKSDSGSKISDFTWRPSREARIAENIESIGLKLFPNDAKQIWAISPSLTERQWDVIGGRGGSDKTLAEAMAEIVKAQKLKEILGPPLYVR